MYTQRRGFSIEFEIYASRSGKLTKLFSSFQSGGGAPIIGLHFYVTFESVKNETSRTF